ncbi:MAG: hypothetical protein Unbinned2716contig1000_41 [Prokaryotic dsDNA virus sp.]|nr:MAG: hypothetical protein Unbinned2716contig1000_41 [Prokaryotic dsDNA virus sp.]|tara:strand:+ start:9123 stop:9557 length:435 start_codon:yes stop_codon:yes gene_type:complete
MKIEKLETKQDIMNRIYIDNGLVESDLHEDKRGFKYVKREGIEKIIDKRNIQVHLELKLCNLGMPEGRDNVVIMATGKMGNKMIQSFGSANDKSCNTFQQKIMVEMAEKRAKARCVLQLAGLYKANIKSEDEFDSMQPVNSLKK